MNTSRRLHRIARPYYGILAIGLALLIVTTVLDTAVISVLLTALLFLVVGPKSLSQSGFSLRIMDYDFGREMSRLIGSSDKVALLIALSILSLAVVLVKCVCQARQGYLLQKFGFLMARDSSQFEMILQEASAPGSFLH